MLLLWVSSLIIKVRVIRKPRITIEYDAFLIVLIIIYGLYELRQLINAIIY